MNISEVFIRRPIATALLMAGIFLFGLVSYELLPVAALPNVEFPTIVVTGQLPGANPTTMAETVATPLENEFTQIPGLSQMTSTSGLGQSTITLQFDLSVDINAAASQVQQQIQAASGYLPKNMPNPPTYRETNPADRPILIYAVRSDAMPLYQLDAYANTVLAQSLSTVPGVGQVLIGGEQEPAVTVQVDPGALDSRGISLAQISTALSNATLDSPKGNLEGEQQQVTLNTNDQLVNASQFRNIIVAYQNGAPITLKDIATVINSAQNTRTGAWFNGKPAELLLIFRAANANTVKVVDQVKSILPQLERSIPPSVHVDLLSDRSQIIRASVSDVERTLLITAALVILVIFAFLRKPWATAIPSVTVPLSIVATFGAMYLFGYSLDNLSLMALSIAIGFVVDDAIVMIENIVRHIEAGEPGFEAALRGAGQIGFTIISITFSLIAVFIPLLLMSGIVGRLFHEFAMTVGIAVVVSAFIALTLTPMMCSLFLAHEHERQPGRISRAFERFFDWMLAEYDRGLHWVFRHQLLTLLSTIALIALTGYLYYVIPKGFIPQEDTGFLFGQLEARQDISFAAMSKLENQTADIILQNPAVAGLVGFAGATGGNSSENTARIFIQLKPFAERVGIQKVMQQLRPKIASQVIGANFYMQAAQDITVGGRLEQAQYQYTLTDTNSDELNHWAPILLSKMRGMKILTDVASDQQIASPQLNIEVDRDAASTYGVTLSAVDAALYAAFGQEQVTTIYLPTQQAKVVLEVQPKFQRQRADLSQIYVPGTSSRGVTTQIPLSSVAHYTNSVVPLTVNHQGVFPAVTLSFNLAPGVALSQAVDAISALNTQIHAPETLLGSFQGTAQAFQASLTTTPLLIAASIVVIYVVLGMLYESFIHPITILSSLPSAGVGALLMLMMFGYDLTLIAFIGIILLIGIVKKNAIMMIDFALEAERNEGKGPLEAIHQACLLRFRPIMMTTMCALFAGLPLAVGTGAGSDLRRPLGIAIVGGLLVSQSLTLYTTPIIYLYLDRLSHWLGGGRTLSPGDLALPSPPSA
ncbi:MAG TPA: efflux RND transporter permease subunit [Xanthobacteraceae bacterium]|nr:efflux RND transporter permease subunit [Xanthobacteraceae bacterium]